MTLVLPSAGRVGECDPHPALFTTGVGLLRAPRRIMVAAERYGVALPWPPGVHRITRALLLAPTVTPCGLVTWVTPLWLDALWLCREVEVFAALCTALRDCRSGGLPPGGGSPG